MRHLCFLIFSVILLSACKDNASQKQKAAARDQQDGLEKLGPMPSGTAWSINKAGYWVTAEHVVRQCSQVFINYNPLNDEDAIAYKDPLLGKVDLKEVRVVGTHKDRDIAVLKGENNRNYFSLSDIVKPDKGHEAFVFGYPLGKKGALRVEYTGQLARYNHDILTVWRVVERTPYAAQLFGISGAPVLDKQGEVFGTLILGRGDGELVFIATANNIRELVEDHRLHVDLPSRYKKPIKASNITQRDKDIRGRTLVTKVYCRR